MAKAYIKLITVFGYGFDYKNFAMYFGPYSDKKTAFRSLKENGWVKDGGGPWYPGNFFTNSFFRAEIIDECPTKLQKPEDLPKV